MVRHAIGCAAKSAGLGKGAISELMGHGGDGRISAQPLPNVGYRHADGRVRRVLLVAPESVDEDVWRSVVSRLAGASLVAEAGGETVGMLAPIAEPDPMLARYRGEGRCWTSATPVVLPGWDSDRRRPRPERSARRLLRHAGVSEALLERATFSRAPRLRGSTHPLSYRRPGHLSRYPWEAQNSVGSNSETVLRLKGERAAEVDVWHVQPSMSATLTPRNFVLPCWTAAAHASAG